MLRKACLAIGVSDPPPLRFLPGAVNGAKAIAGWADRWGYKTELLIDDQDPVLMDTVETALLRLLGQGGEIDRLIVYFAGHGLSRDMFEDLWLLSDWHESQRAVAVGMLRSRLQRYGIGQIAIIADACRSMPSDAETAELVADGVLGRGPVALNQPLIDHLKASSKYQAAYMIPGKKKDDDRCIFSGLLEEALWGRHADAFDGTSITSQSLVKCLRNKVPAKATEYGVELTPELISGFERPEDIYLTQPVAAPPPAWQWPPPAAAVKLGAEADSSGGRRGWSTKDVAKSLPPFPGLDKLEFGLAPTKFQLEPAGDGEGRSAPLTEMVAVERRQIEESAERRNKRFANLVAEYQSEQSPTHYETDCGLSISGGSALDVVVGGGAGVEHDQGERIGWRIDLPNHGGRQLPVGLLAKLESGVWVGAAALPKFIVRLGVEPARSNGLPERAVSLIYRSTPGGYFDDRPAERALAKLRSGLLDEAHAVDFALQLRWEKHSDPVLGVISAYMYESRADLESIRQIAYFYAQKGQPIPYDIALLAQVRVVRNGPALFAQIPAIPERTPRTELEEKHEWTYHATPAIEGIVGGVFPWLRQGWSLLAERDEPLVNPALGEMADELLPATFMTMTAEGGSRLAAMLRAGDI